MPSVRAAATSWKRVADDASTTVWPIRWWACTSCQASGKTRPASRLANTPLAHLEHVVLVVAVEAGETDLDELVEVVLGLHAAQREGRGAKRLERTDLAAAHPVEVEVHRRVAVDEGAVEVEERRDMRSLGGGVHLG